MTPVPAKPAAGVPKGSLSKWLSGHKWEAGLGAGGIVVTVYLAYRSRKSSGGASGGSGSSSTNASSALPLSYYPPTAGGSGGSFDAGQFGDVLSQLSQELNTIAGQQPASPVAGTPAAPAPTPGFGLVDTALGQMVWLGVTGPGGSTSGDYQVGGGAPVYFGNAGSLAQGGTQQGGVDVYTPAGNAGLVSTKPGA